MQKVMSFFLAIIVCFSLAACGENKEKHPMAVFKEDKIIAEIGMTKDEIIKNLGEGYSQKDEGTCFDYLEIEVYFREDKVKQIEIYGEPYSDYLGNTPGEEYTGSKFILYDKKKNVIGNYDRRVDVPKDSDECKYVIEYYSGDKGLSIISLFDYQTFIHDN